MSEHKGITLSGKFAVQIWFWYRKETEGQTQETQKKAGQTGQEGEEEERQKCDEREEEER
ncbi:MAG: hypothetical protein GY941_20265 [Planctomycetes bacterium]|nr:hypothetical protein [Planctomycetota bacterium]